MSTKSVKLRKKNRFKQVRSLAIILLLISILNGVPYFFIMGLILLGTVLFSHVFITYMYRPIGVEAKWNGKSLFPGEQINLSLVLRNNCGISIPQLLWEFKLTKKLEAVEQPSDEGKLKDTYRSKCSLGSNEGVAYSFEFTAVKRGVARVEDARVKLRDPLRLGEAEVEFYLPSQEVVIYPTLLPIHGLEKLQFAPLGEKSVPLSAFEDLTYKLGARPYQSGDPFQRIDWKSSARKQELHTKIIDKTAQAEFIFLGNVRTHEEAWRGTDDVFTERTISVLASLGEFALKNKTPYQMHINIKNVGKKSSLRIQRGEGRKHYISTLDTLARANQFATHPFEQTLYKAQQELLEGKIVVVISPFLTENMKRTIQQMCQKGVPVYLIRTEQEKQFIEKMGQGMIRYA
jgi:uncharacterized protein (DUF58 family)